MMLWVYTIPSGVKVCGSKYMTEETRPKLTKQKLCCFLVWPSKDELHHIHVSFKNLNLIFYFRNLHWDQFHTF